MSESQQPGQSAGHNFLPDPEPMTHFLSDVCDDLQQAHASGRISTEDLEKLLQKTRQMLESTKDLFTHIVLALLKK